MTLERLLWVFLAGGLGSGARYLIGVWASGRLGTTFPYGTLIVNVLGCFLMAFVMQRSLQGSGFSPTLRLALTTGFMGGLTTYSAFNWETTALLTSGARVAALGNVLLTLVSCFVAGLAGLAVGR
jgi:CrcB protein